MAIKFSLWKKRTRQWLKLIGDFQKLNLNRFSFLLINVNKFGTFR